METLIGRSSKFRSPLPTQVARAGRPSIISYGCMSCIQNHGCLSDLDAFSVTRAQSMLQWAVGSMCHRKSEQNKCEYRNRRKERKDLVHLFWICVCPAPQQPSPLTGWVDLTSLTILRADMEMINCRTGVACMCSVDIPRT